MRTMPRADVTQGSGTTTFWAVQNENRAVERLLSRVANATVFCDPDFAALAATFPDPAGRYRVERLPQTADALDAAALRPTVAGRDVFLFAQSGYPAFEAALAPIVRQAGGQFLSWPYDVLPSFVGVDDSWQRADVPVQAPGRTYTIACTARSGSTFLADILARNGFGNPKEHIRGPLIALFRQRAAFDLDVPRLLRTMAARGERNRFFGTKVISGFYWDLLGSLGPADREAFREILWSHPVVYLVRASKVEQAVSDFVAREIKVWHVREPAKLARYAELTAAIQFNFDDINRRYGMYLADETRLRDFVAGLPQVHTVAYEDLTSQTQRTVDAVAQFISGGNADRSLDITSDVIKTANDVNRSFCEQFVAQAKRRGLYADRLDDPMVAELR